MDAGVRIDKFLWAVRVYKTRSQATEACKKSKVLVNNQEVKPSREIKPGDTIKAERDHLWQTFVVLQLLNNRVSAKLAPDYIRNDTPVAEIEAHRIKMKTRFENRPFGFGRPTKKERRIIEKFKNQDEL